MLMSFSQQGFGMSIWYLQHSVWYPHGLNQLFSNSYHHPRKISELRQSKELRERITEEKHTLKEWMCAGFSRKTYSSDFGYHVLWTSFRRRDYWKFKLVGKEVPRMNWHFPKIKFILSSVLMSLGMSWYQMCNGTRQICMANDIEMLL